MLKFVGTLRNGSSRIGPRSTTWGVSNHQMISPCSTTATASQTKVEKPVTSKTGALLKPREKSKFTMVNLIFNSLNDDMSIKSDPEPGKIKQPNLEDFLNVSNDKFLNHGRAVAAITALCRWVEKGKVKFTDFENDPRYLKLCSVLAEKSAKGGPRGPKASNTIYNIDEFNHFYTNLSTLTIDQTVKIMSSLAVKQRRTKPILRALAGNIYNSNQDLSIKNIADILYSMATLSFPDEPLLQKISNDLQSSINEVNQSPIIGSILTSLGMLRYRDDALMDKLSQWIVKHKDILRTQDLGALIMTLAMTNYCPVNSKVLFEEVVSTLKETDMIRSSEWLDIIWALTVLDKAQPDQVQSVLNNKFISKLSDDDEIPLVKKIKLLNINGAAQLLMKNYLGPYLDDGSPVFDIRIVKIKEKQAFVKAITDALANLFPSREYFRVNVNTGTGHFLDVEFYMNNKSSPVLIENISLHPLALRIAIVANYYHDYCIGNKQLLGTVDLCCRLLEAKGYKILDISHSEFHTEDKLLKRITYVNDRIKSIVK